MLYFCSSCYHNGMSSIKINTVHDSFTISSAQNTVLLCLQYNCFICNKNFRMIYYQMSSMVTQLFMA